jgi:hypothetical protein
LKLTQCPAPPLSCGPPHGCAGIVGLDATPASAP